MEAWRILSITLLAGEMSQMYDILNLIDEVKFMDYRVDIGLKFLRNHEQFSKILV